MHSVQTMQGVWIHPQGGIHFARTQIVRVAMFLHHKPRLSYWLKSCMSILLGIWGTVHKGAPIWLGTRLLELPCFYVTCTGSSGKTLLVVQEMCKTFSVVQAFGASILPRIWGIHLTGNHIARVAMFLCHARSPLYW